jgi:hypothetical protein
MDNPEIIIDSILRLGIAAKTTTAMMATIFTRSLAQTVSRNDLRPLL